MWDSIARGVRSYGTYLLAVAVVGLLFRSAFGLPAAPMDEGILLSYPELSAAGARPGVDYIHPYGPGSLWLLQACYRLFGASVATERSVGLCYRLAIIAGVFAFARRKGRSVGVGSALLSALLLSPLGTAALAWFGALSALIWALYLSSDAPRPGKALAAGALLGTTLVVRADLALVVIAAAAPLVFAMSSRARLACAVGAIVGVLPLVLYVHDISIAEAYRSMLLEPAARAPAHVLPIPPRDFQVSWLFGLTLLAALGLLARGAISARTRSVESAPADLSLGLMAVTLLPQLLQRADQWHITYVGCVCIPLLPAALVDLYERWRGSGSGRARVEQLAAAAVALAVVAGSYEIVGLRALKGALKSLGLPTLGESHWVRHAGRAFPLDDAQRARNLEDVVSRLAQLAVAGQRLFVGPRDLARPNYNDAFVYFMVPDLKPASYFVAVVPGITIPASDIARADFLVLTSYYDSRGPAVHPNAQALEAERIITNEFCEVMRRGSYQLFERCSRSTAARTEAGADLPADGTRCSRRAERACPWSDSDHLDRIPWR